MMLNTWKFLVCISMVITVSPLAKGAGKPPTPLDGMPLLTEVFPRAFHFRQSEGVAANPRVSYEEWEEKFTVLDGIMGKCLDEEIPNRSGRNIDFFTRYKRAYPDKAVFLHFNGNARDPGFETEPYFAGHWLYFNGCHTTREVAGAEDATIINVEDPGLFGTDMGRYGDKNEDLGICLIDAEGRPDWSQSEQLELVAIDAKAKTLTVRRGSFGTTPRAFPEGAYIAAHATEGPWGRRSHLLWNYNYATTCPRDASGATCSDRLRADLVRWFGPEGPLAAFDGVEFDVLHWRCPGGRSGLRFADVDADGEPDGGIIDGVNVYGLGVDRHLAKLRAAVGADFLLMADGHSPNNQRSVKILNGIESEGWPSLNDPELRDWSGGLNRHAYWNAHARPTRFNYINHKFMDKGERVEVPFSTTRLVLAAAQFTDAAFTFSYTPPQDDAPPLDVWDELCLGTENKKRWLGPPIGPARHLGFDEPDLLDGAGSAMPLEFLGRWQSSDATVEKTQGGLQFSGRDATQDTMQATFGGLRVPEGDLLIRCTLSAAPRALYGGGVPRMVRFGVRSVGALIAEEPSAAFYCVRDGEETPIKPNEQGATVRYRPNHTINDESHDAYLAHPPYGANQGPGYTVWQETRPLSDDARLLSFFTGLNPAPNSSDGVTFAVEIVVDEQTTALFREHQTEYAWIGRHLDLTPWKGRQVTLRFITDCGTNDSSTADHAYWGDVRIASPGEQALPPLNTPDLIMAWAGEQPFEASFYFRDVGPREVDLTFEAEGEGPVHIKDLRVYNAPDAMARTFENGLVLANPSNKPHTFDLRALYPNAKLRRIPGKKTQDPLINNGQPVGNSVTLAAKDALFLVKPG
ncbi:MAG: hypothetical protein U9Q79_01160 [Candidatus Hydrogenedentes bacterium]|nr:hypothetical protein [Candidatus Hydrogenedentota bacterium]